MFSIKGLPHKAYIVSSCMRDKKIICGGGIEYVWYIRKPHRETYLHNY